MPLSKRDARRLIRLLGEYQDLLESSIESLLVCGKPPADKGDAAQLRLDRRNWRAAEDMVRKLEAAR